MKSKWKVGYRLEGMSVQYCAYRLLDVSVSDNPANREYDRNWYHKRETAEQAAAMLNSEKGAYA